MSVPLRGEVWLVDLGMAAKIRPALVVSVPPGDADRALVTLVPHTTSVRGTAYEAVIPLGFLKPGAFDVQGIVSVPFPRLIRRLGRVSLAQLSSLESVLSSWLGLSFGRAPSGT